MVDLFAGLSALSTGLTATKQLSAAVLEGKVDAKAHELAIASNKEIMEIQTTIIQIQQAMFASQLENQRLQKELETVQIKDKKENMYKLTKNEHGMVLLEYQGEPHHFACPSCKETSGLYIPLQMLGKTLLKCTSCQNDYRIAPYQPIKISRY
jgi:DNA-directed RNA polymerase subunit M/transcription elongation factor TFIIS